MADLKQWTLEKLFAGRPASLRLFHLVREFIETIGPVEMTVTKTQVSFGVRTKFAWVWLPQLWTHARAEDSITLTFDHGERVDDPRIVAAVEPRLGRWTHHVVITEPADLDDVVKGWLREAYDSGTIDRRKRAHKRPEPE